MTYRDTEYLKRPKLRHPIYFGVVKLIDKHHIVQLQSTTRMLLVPPKCKIIMVLSNYSFSNIAIATLDFSLLLLLYVSLINIFPFHQNLFRILCAPIIFSRTVIQYKLTIIDQHYLQLK